MSTVIKDESVSPLHLVSKVTGEMRNRNPLLFRVSFAHLILLLLMLIILPFDERLVTGINPWIKPIKFALANAIYMLTIGWLIYHLPTADKTRRKISRLVAISIIAETVVITFQAARGTTSHFNLSSLANAGLQSIMGIMIVINTVVVAYITWKFWKTTSAVPAPYLWGIRLGLLIFLLASMEGFVMVSNHAHSVGVADGGAGLPVMSWSRKGGDLRIAHFVGLHALQILPIFGLLFSLPHVARRIINPVFWIWVVGILYAGLSLLLFLQALAGSPLISY